MRMASLGSPKSDSVEQLSFRPEHALHVTQRGLHRVVSRQFADPLRILPVRIKAGALSDNTPSRDLLLSPDHAIFLEGGLFQAGALVNGTTILRESNFPMTFTYHHVELDDHSLILAENVPAETFIDYVDRMAFDNWEEHQAAYPDGRPIVEMPYPRAKAHRQVPPHLRDALARRAVAFLGLTASSAA
jgi:Hint domain